MPRDRRSPWGVSRGPDGHYTHTEQTYCRVPHPFAGFAKGWERTPSTFARTWPGSPGRAATFGGNLGAMPPPVTLVFLPCRFLWRFYRHRDTPPAGVGICVPALAAPTLRRARSLKTHGLNETAANPPKSPQTTK